MDFTLLAVSNSITADKKELRLWLRPDARTRDGRGEDMRQWPCLCTVGGKIGAARFSGFLLWGSKAGRKGFPPAKPSPASLSS